MSRLKRIVDDYMQKVSGLREHCDRCLRTERWGGSVVLMIVDAAFTSIGLNYFTAVVPKVEEFNRKFVENGRIKNLKDLAEADIDELMFDKGYLYYMRSGQLIARLERRDVLSPLKQRIYETIKENTQLQKRFTALSEIGNASTYSKIMDEVLCVYDDLEKVVIGKEVYFYVKGFLKKSEIEKEVRRLEKNCSKVQSRRSELGWKFESFCQTTTDIMWYSGDLKVERMWWEKTVLRSGKVSYNRKCSRASNPRRVWEFDRILNLTLAPFNNSRYPRKIRLVFEMKYWKDPRKEHWDSFIWKLADTFEFGTEITIRDVQGNRVSVRVPKFNVVPVMALAWQGRPTIRVRLGNQVKEYTLAQYIISQGGLVIFVREFEEYLAKKVGKPVSFKKIFKEWFATKKEEEDFTTYLLEYLGLARSKHGFVSQTTHSPFLSRQTGQNPGRFREKENAGSRKAHGAGG